MERNIKKEHGKEHKKQLKKMHEKEREGGGDEEGGMKQRKLYTHADRQTDGQTGRWTDSQQTS